MKVGIMQGRLSKAPLGKDLDWFPFDNWEKEFIHAREIGFNYIELVIDRYESKYNPLLTNEGKKKLLELSIKYSININYVCYNSIIEKSILLDSTINEIKKRISDFSELKIRNLILPLFGCSEINKSNISKVSNQIKEIYYFAKNKNIKLLLESDLPFNKQKTFLDFHLRELNIGIVYDIGNASSQKHNVLEEFYSGREYIKHIHIKDKNLKKENVNLGEGIVDFKKIIPCLKKFKNINLTLETDRGQNPKITQKNNIIFLKKLLQE